MANKPCPTCTLDPNKHISQQEGLCATFNWLVSCMSNITGGKYIEVKWPSSDTPTIEYTGPEPPANGGFGGGGGGGLDNAVTNITTEEIEDGIQLKWSYADGNTGEQFFPNSGSPIPPTPPEPTPGVYVDSLNGLKGDVNLVAEDDTNITFSQDGNNIKIGVYYS